MSEVYVPIALSQSAVVSGSGLSASQPSNFTCPLDWRKFRPAPSGSSIPGDNYRIHLYSEVYNVIEKMRLLPEGSDFHLPEDVSGAAHTVLGLLLNVNVPAPKVMNEDSEALILSWAAGQKKSYLHIDSEEVDYLEVGRPEQNLAAPLGRVEDFNLRSFFEYFSSANRTTASDANT